MKTNSGQFKKGEHRAPKTEFKKGQTPWNKGKEYTAILGDKHPQWKGGKPDCLDCGVKLKKYTSERCSPCHLKSPKAKAHLQTISIKPGMYSKENHPNWKGGITKLDRLERVKFRQTTQKTVFERDDYTCTICDIRGGYLQVDHIKKWADYPDLRFDLDNCRTVCMACHYYITFKRKLPEGVIWGHNLSRRIAS